ncbi:hypothetical protein P168DRAFT_290498 [Aspergillus campestris IBT 28561]|uniref:Uncharacterized protein n=1 Tax=Aspergillus campestris (strain IBT 28561) TaxID=1392248 RepID=A0A2I1D3J0_ASPC2|nr:uncharacterized protein P168DRAFT_290498 [Aspergillus campestris IBT 28561]PKY04433.1 hypothetical protein P168DRAFT_290498 [Aspergillus campestris IBT 28561]
MHLTLIFAVAFFTISPALARADPPNFLTDCLFECETEPFDCPPHLNSHHVDNCWTCCHAT